MEETIKKIHQLCREIYEYLDERFVWYKNFWERPYVKETLNFHWNTSYINRWICHEHVGYSGKDNKLNIRINDNLSYIDSTYERLSSDWAVIKKSIEETDALTLENEKNERIKQLEKELNDLKSK